MTVTPKHTPGTWAVQGEINARYLRGIGDVLLVRRDDARDNRYVAIVCFDAMGDDHDPRTSDEERSANARLIAAAPEMLEALKGVVRVADRDTIEFRAARAAISKALP